MLAADIKVEGVVRLRKGREFAALQGHPWIFSGAVLIDPTTRLSILDGSIVEVQSDDGRPLGLAFYNSRTSIALRLFSTSASAKGRPPGEIISELLTSALILRDRWLPSSLTCRRLVNAEGDRLPGLVVDQYGKHLVVQIGTAGMDLLKPLIKDLLIQNTSADSIYERSDSGSREEEGLNPSIESLHGETPLEVLAEEGSMRLLINIKEGQKTGFFIDQREMRRFVLESSSGKRVLNCFSYTGGFSVAALLGGATRVVSVDSSENAISLCTRNVELNEGTTRHEAKCANAFDYLGGTHERFDLVILDPPAFAKQRGHLKNAMKAYRQINMAGLKLVTPGGMLITSSCSNYVSQSDFEQEILKVAADSGRQVSIAGRHRHAVDHPVAAAHEQGNYLKSLILLVQ